VVGRSYGELVAWENVTAILAISPGGGLARHGEGNGNSGHMTCKFRQAEYSWPGENDIFRPKFSSCFCFGLALLSI
jgi:hypothetical protein